MRFAFAIKIPTEKIEKLKKTTFTGVYFNFFIQNFGQITRCHWKSFNNYAWNSARIPFRKANGVRFISNRNEG